MFGFSAESTTHVLLCDEIKPEVVLEIYNKSSFDVVLLFLSGNHRIHYSFWPTNVVMITSWPSSRLTVTTYKPMNVCVWTSTALYHLHNDPTRRDFSCYLYRPGLSAILTLLEVALHFHASRGRPPFSRFSRSPSIFLWTDLCKIDKLNGHNSTIYTMSLSWCVLISRCHVLHIVVKLIRQKSHILHYVVR